MHSLTDQKIAIFVLQLFGLQLSHSLTHSHMYHGNGFTVLLIYLFFFSPLFPIFLSFLRNKTQSKKASWLRAIALFLKKLVLRLRVFFC